MSVLSKIASMFEGATISAMKIEMKYLKERNESQERALTTAWEQFVYSPSIHDGGSFNGGIVKEQGVRIGRSGSMMYVVDDNDRAIGEGFHHIDVKRMEGKTGSSRYALNSGFEAMHCIN